jgi:hypothetical protein
MVVTGKLPFFSVTVPTGTACWAAAPAALPAGLLPLSLQATSIAPNAKAEEMMKARRIMLKSLVRLAIAVRSTIRPERERGLYKRHDRSGFKCHRPNLRKLCEVT